MKEYYIHFRVLSKNHKEVGERNVTTHWRILGGDNVYPEQRAKEIVKAFKQADIRCYSSEAKKKSTPNEDNEHAGS